MCISFLLCNFCFIGSVTKERILVVACVHARIQKMYGKCSLLIKAKELSMYFFERRTTYLLLGAAHQSHMFADETYTTATTTYGNITSDITTDGSELASPTEIVPLMHVQ